MPVTLALNVERRHASTSPSPLRFSLCSLHVFNPLTWPWLERYQCEFSPASFPLPVRMPFLHRVTPYTIESPSHADGATSAYHGLHRHISSQSASHKGLARSPLAFTHALLYLILLHRTLSEAWNVALALSFILTFIFLELMQGPFGLRFAITSSGLRRQYIPHHAAHIARLGTEVKYYSFPIVDRSLPHSIAYIHQIISVLKDNACRRCITAIHSGE